LKMKNQAKGWPTRQLGTSREIVQSGQTTPCYDADFYPFGGEIAYVDNCPPNYKFTGKERDTETGLDDLGARYYSSALGRLASTDPIVVTQQRLTDPQELNLYAYARNTPTRFVDPTGEILTVSGDTNTAIQYIQQIIGSDAKIHCTNNTCTVTVDDNEDEDCGAVIACTGLDGPENEGLSLIEDLIDSKYHYDLSVSQTVETAAVDKKGNPVKRDVGVELNLPPFPDQAQGPKSNPKPGIDDQVVINPNVGMKSNWPGGGGIPPPYWLIAFHELAEAYAKIDGHAKTYDEGHNAANRREDMLRMERPELAKYIPGGGGNKGELSEVPIKH
jgi:RHS repeat-associated protein